MLASKYRELLCATREYARAQGIRAEFSFHRELSSLIRLGNSSVALSTSEDLIRLDVTVIDGRKSGSYSLTSDLVSEGQLREVLGLARENCAVALEKDYDPIFGELDDDFDDCTGQDQALANLSADAKTGLCAEVIETLAPRGNYTFSGSWSSGMTEMYFLTTANDREAYRCLTDGRLLLVLKEKAKKWELSAEQAGNSLGAFSADVAIKEFQELLPVYEGNAGFRTPLGPIRVIFGPQAIAELVGLTIWGGLTGRGWEEKRAFTSGKQFGDALFSEQVSMYDDPDDPFVYRMPFDFKGKRRQRFPLIENGLFRGLMYESAVAARYGKACTGHDVSNPDVVLAPGTAPAGMEAGLALAGEGLYIPHLHYIHMPDPSRGQFTGSSRFNAQRVEGGQITAPLLSSRITDTLTNVLSHVVAVSSRSVMVDVSSTYDRRSPTAVSVPEYLICDNVRISDVAESF